MKFACQTNHFGVGLSSGLPYKSSREILWCFLVLTKTSSDTIKFEKYKKERKKTKKGERKEEGEEEKGRIEGRR